MDDDCKDYKKNKPQQRFYKPGSGPLRRSRYGLDSKMDSCDIDNGPRAREPHYGSQHSINGEETPNNRYRKPEQQLYVPRIGDSCSDIDKQYKNSLKCDSSSQHYNKRMTDKKDNINLPGGTGFSSKNGGSDSSYKDGTNNDVNYNRHYRQGSEARSVSPTQNLSNQKSLERNRDSKSMETWAGRHKTGSGGKPPSGRRNSAGFSSDCRPKHLINLDNIPPRFRKKYSEQSGHQSFDNVDQLNRCSNDFQSYHTGQFYGSNNTNWSQTLPSRGRGRLRDNEHFDREKFINSYLKNYERQSSRRSTPSNSYVNLYETIPPVNNSTPKVSDFQSSDIEHSKSAYDNESSNCISNSNEVKHNHKDSDDKTEGSDNQNDSEPVSNISTNLSDMTILDWTEEVEKNIKLDEMCDSSTSFSQSLKSSNPQDKRSAPPPESKKSNNKSRRRDRRSSSRGNINSDKRERNRKDSNVSVQYEPERSRRDSNVSIQHETQPYGLKHRERERRDSHRSNRSSTIGNSRDDLDRWRSVRSYSREQSSERRIVSQCNSRDVSTNRALSPKDSDGFRVPSTSGKSATWSNQANQKKSNVAWNGGRTPSIDRKHSPTPSISGEGGEGAGSSAGCGGGGGGGRRSRKRTGRRRRNAENLQPTPHPPGAVPAPTNINWRDEIIESKKHQSDRQPESNNQRNRLNSVLSEKSVTEPSNQPGLIVLPQSSMSHLQKEQGRGENMETRKTLFDHQNPSKPIIVQTSPTKNDIRMERGVKESSRVNYEAGDTSRGARHVALLQKVDRADAILKMHTMRGPLTLAANWPDVVETRKFLQSALQRLLMSDLKYCQADNIEHQFWKILYYHFIENLRKSISQVTPEEKPQVVKLINTIIEEGNIFFENLVHMLEETYKFNTEDHINDNHNLPPKGLGYVGLALISVQKLYVFLGDLARYKEQVNESNNYAKSKFWYTKAQQINPKNGRPYNQLAILAIYARRKLDAVYYYMRSLMSSNPFQSARESLLSLFDENRKKYETAERKRRAAAESVKSGEIGAEVEAKQGAGLRREVWVRASGHRTTTLRPATEDTLANISPVELNKNFITSYLYVHGKLITKVDMETFHTSAAHMLRQFRALLHRQPLPTPSARLLQLTALNMYAVETNSASLKGNNGGERSGWLDCALGVSLLMFGALLERCCALLPEPAHTQQHADALLLLPAIKVWSDWMLCHSSVWNPPPCLDNFEMESENDPWDWLAKLMNILEALDDKSIEIENESKEGYVPVRLPEDSSLAGFTPLMYMEPVAAWLPSELPVAPHTAEHVLRTRRLLFFGTEYLVGVDPPVLKLEYPAGAQPRYVSAVERTQPNLPLQQLSEDSADEESVNDVASGPQGLAEVPEGADETTRKLLRRKEQLESRKATLERRRQRMQEMLSTGWVSVEVVVRPRWLVPDTNCFIDHLSLLQQAAQPNAYQLAVPLVVVSELEGLRRCSRLGEAARNALAWVSAEGSGSAGNVRLATARGSLLAARGLAFTEEQDQTRSTNDDRVLATALNLQANLANDSESVVQESHDKCVRRIREVVLLTDDRNLRVKALAADLPARDLPSFVQWAGLHSEASNANAASAIPDVN